MSVFGLFYYRYIQTTDLSFNPGNPASYGGRFAFLVPDNLNLNKLEEWRKASTNNTARHEKRPTHDVCVGLSLLQQKHLPRERGVLCS